MIKYKLNRVKRSPGVSFLISGHPTIQRLENGHQNGQNVFFVSCRWLLCNKYTWKSYCLLLILQITYLCTYLCTYTTNYLFVYPMWSVTGSGVNQPWNSRAANYRRQTGSLVFAVFKNMHVEITIFNISDFSRYSDNSPLDISLSDISPRINRSI